MNRVSPAYAALILLRSCQIFPACSVSGFNFRTARRILKTSSITISTDVIFLNLVTNYLFSYLKYSILLAKLSLMAMSRLSCLVISPSVKVILMFDMKLWLNLSDTSSKNLTYLFCSDSNIVVLKSFPSCMSLSVLIGLMFRYPRFVLSLSCWYLFSSSWYWLFRSFKNYYKDLICPLRYKIYLSLLQG